MLATVVQKLRSLLLDVWREACRHIEISEAGANIAAMLSRHLPQEKFQLLRLDPEQSLLWTVLSVDESGVETHTGTGRTLPAADTKRLVDWCKNGKLFQSHRRFAGILKLVLIEAAERDILAVPLAGEHGTLGLVLVTAAEGQAFFESHHEILVALREPLAVALENDTRVQELATLREAAEADRGSLLRRLGKKDMVDEIVGESSGLRPVMERVDLVSGSDVPVLILGETGTGKEVVARAIHSRSPNKHGPFIRVNCGAIPHELIDSQLFGHEKGSFTGAEQTRQGWFERANGGTLFLDEIGELPLDAQVRFLRVLQDGYVERVGGHQPIHVEVRIVAATHRDLASMVRERTFREDLWYRLAVFPILLPPLRDRRDDIPELANHFASRAATRFGLPSAQPSPADIRLLQQYDWPGNIRELGAVIDRAAILGNGRGLEVAKALGLNQVPGVRGASKSTLGSLRPQELKAEHIVSLDDATKYHIQAALQVTDGRIEGKKGAAHLLKINPHTLRARMRKLGIDWSTYRASS